MGCMLLCMEKVNIAVTYNSGSVNSSTLSVPCSMYFVMHALCLPKSCLIQLCFYGKCN